MAEAGLLVNHVGNNKALEEGSDDSDCVAPQQQHRRWPLYAAGLLAAGLLGAAAYGGRQAAPAAPARPRGIVQFQDTQMVSDDLQVMGIGGDGKSKETCKTAAKGDHCFKNVVWSMSQGIRKHPKWYHGLTRRSRFDEFQAHVHKNNRSTCPMPCLRPGCETAEPGSACHQSAMWAMTEGIKKHPSWYPGLTPNSPFEDFQMRVHKYNSSRCPLPCSPQPFKVTALFCWSVVRPEGPELDLVKAQLKAKAGIFACDNYALVSDKEIHVSDGPLGPVKTVTIPTTKLSGYTKDGTAPNAPIFVNAWGAIRGLASKTDYDWMVKVDPDTVLIPERLREQLANPPQNPYPTPYQSPANRGVFVTNCDKMAAWGAGWGNGWPMMYGSVEILSRAAMETYYENVDDCKGSMPWQGMGEDAFMGLCLRNLKVGELFIKQGDANCGGAACTDPSKAAYHPKKSAAEWLQCLSEAQR